MNSLNSRPDVLHQVTSTESGYAHSAGRQTDRQADTLSIAKEYIKAGICVIPIKPDGTKGPALPKWEQYQKRKSSDAELEAWFSNGRNGLAAVGGAVSANLLQIDFDDKETHQKYLTLAQELGLSHLLENSAKVRTPKKGWHYYFRSGTPQKTEKLAMRPEPDTQKQTTLIELKAEGGYTLLPGSPIACHEEHRPYVLESGNFDALTVLSDQEVDALLALARHFDERPAKDLDPGKDFETKDNSGNRPGDDFNRRADWHQLLTGWIWVYEKGNVYYLRRPGKDKGISATINHGGTNRLRVFSTSTTFDITRSYTPFQAYALLEHGSNFKAAARQLAALGYGLVSPKDNGVQNMNAPPEWPTLDKAALHGLAGKIVAAATHNSEADPAAVLAAVLERAGATFGDTRYFNVGETKHPARNMSVVVGASSRARKGTSVDPVSRIFEAAESIAGDPKLKVAYGPLSSGEGLINAVRDPSEKKDKEGNPIDAGVEDKRLLVIEGELVASLKAIQREGNTLSAIIRMAWDKGNIAPLTKTNPLRATGAHINILAHITRNELAKELDSVEMWNGWANRHLWWCARRAKEVAFPQPMDDGVVSALAQELAAAIKKARSSGRINFDPVAKQVWGEMYPLITKDEPGMFGCVIARAEAHVIRLSLTYALLDGSEMILPIHLKSALAAWKYCRESARYIFGNTETDPHAERILKALKEGEKTLTQINELFSGHVNTKPILTELQAIGRINQRKEGGGKGVGKQTTYFSLAPGFGFAEESTD